MSTKLLLRLWELMILIAVPTLSYMAYKEYQILNEIAIAMHLL